MEDVVLHLQPGSAAGLSRLLETTEKLLESFPCRTPPPFTPWSPAAADRHLPIRPARPAPAISDSRTHAHGARNPPQRREVDAGRTHNDPAEEPRDGVCVSETLNCPVPETGRLRPPPHSVPVTESPNRPLPETRLLRPPPHGVPVTESPNRPVPETRLLRMPPHGVPVTESPNRPLPETGLLRPPPDGVPVTELRLRRSWSVFTHRGVLLPPSKHFLHVASVHGLHLHQRVKWVIGRENCGPSGDIEQVWRSLTRSVRRSRLPPCNANIQRERAEIWVFCDAVHSEQAGRFLKDELRLSGTIVLSARQLGNIFSI